ncbi:Bax inhibitor-1 family protein [Companilactobacillus mishanensis]|uniref:Bax inhibitor-1/YccA family protein n=1 Tax=Companilactobacillus mishanensis TaxID=2486008 RepID=A0A5P0ZKA2_9LACO|nr:Bax inhibitor-1 family protein [Companilactobacillus mishanensis]MQS53546.1 hypothetical protein [Companilactobacillus mishanensis]
MEDKQFDVLYKQSQDVGKNDSDYIGKFNFLKQASKYRPQADEAKPLARHIGKVYFIFKLELIYTAALVLGMMQNIEKAVVIEEVIFSFGGITALVLIFASLSLVYVARQHDNLILGVVACLFLCMVIATELFTVIFLMDNSDIIFECLILTITVFGVSAIYGLVTKRDITGWGPALFTALISSIVALVLNLFFQNSLVQNVIMFADIIIFTLYTMYDNQMLKFNFLSKYRDDIPDTNTSWWLLALDGSIDLYADFINLFLDILSLFGSSDDD